MTCLEFLLLHILELGPQSVMDLAEMWEPHTREELAATAIQLKEAGRISWCDHCNRVYLICGDSTGLCLECTLLLAKRVLMDSSEEGGTIQ